MFAKYATTMIVQASTSLKGLIGTNQSLIKTATKKFADINMEPDSHVYLRNRAVSALEIHGPNQNWDAFEYDELNKKYSSFITNPVSVDHIGTEVIGSVLDSEYITSPDIQGELDIPHMPYKDTKAVLLERCAKESVFGKVLEYATANKLVRSSDRNLIVEAVTKTLCEHVGWVENIWAIEKQAAEEHTAGLVQAILANRITDSSMGCMVQKAVCSLCGNVATGELPEHEDFCDCIRLYKGTQMPIDGMLVIPFEINRDIEFFEDSLILPHEFGGKAGGEGADKDAKLLEVFSNRKKKQAAMETAPGFRDAPGGNSGYGTNPSIYVMIGDTPDNVEENKEEFNQQRIDFSEESQQEGSGAGDYPEGTTIKIMVDNDEVDSIVVEENDNGLIVAIDGIDEPLEITLEEVIEVIDYPEEVSYDKEMDITDVPSSERSPEQRAAGKDDNN